MVNHLPLRILDRRWRNYRDSTHQLYASEIRGTADMQKVQWVLGLSCASSNRIGVQKIADIRTRNQFHDHPNVGTRSWIPQIQVGHFVVNISVTNDEIRT